MGQSHDRSTVDLSNLRSTVNDGDFRRPWLSLSLNDTVHDHSTDPVTDHVVNTSPLPASASSSSSSPYPWATDIPALVHSLSHLTANGLTDIGDVLRCKWCEHRKAVRLDLMATYAELKSFMLTQYHLMHDRAPEHWMSPRFSDCSACGQRNCMKPVIPEDKGRINWLFLFLAQLLGCCTLDQLRYFCFHARIHRTAAKDRLLLATYLGIFKQLDPEIRQCLG